MPTHANGAIVSDRKGKIQPLSRCRQNYSDPSSFVIILFCSCVVSFRQGDEERQDGEWRGVCVCVGGGGVIRKECIIKSLGEKIISPKRHDATINVSVQSMKLKALSVWQSN